ncbi:hypothetical protein [Deinococcus yunweiensis]|uniref:hypothetical protein n=1 Tax=Deinococcus yunweiensis TaxID=367282 RepID=UPI00398E82D1
MLSAAQAHLLKWISVGSLLERTDVTGAGNRLELFMGGTVVQRADIDMLEAQGLIETLSTWTMRDYSYVRYGLTSFGLTVLQIREQHDLE